MSESFMDVLNVRISFQKHCRMGMPVEMKIEVYK